MRLLLLGALVLPALAGCGTAVKPVAPAHAATAQRAELSWVESFGNQAERLIFGVHSFEVTKEGWQVGVSLANDTDVSLAVGGSSLPGSRAFGLMLFSTGAHSELETRNAAQSLPTIRTAETFDPALPQTLQPHQTWAGTIAARGPLAAGTWARVVFGTLFPGQRIEAGRLEPSTPTLPDSLRKANISGNLTWITDHAYKLKR